MKRFNLDELLWFIVVVFLDLFMIYLMLTNKMSFYVGNKITRYIYIAITCISIIAIFQIKNIFTTKSSTSIKLKLIPIILALVFGIISISKQETFKHFELNNELKQNKGYTIDKQSLYAHELDNKINDSSNNLNYVENKKLGEDIQKTIVINENNPMILEEIKINPRKYVGKEVEINGFVCKEDYLNNNQFIIGRLVITCCAADSKVVGIIGEYNKSSDLKENEQIKVKGVIKISTIKDEDNLTHNIPVISIGQIEKEK